jgi:hypothetical protein
VTELDSRARGSRLFLLPALAAYTAYTLYFLRPIWRLFPDHLTPNARDPLFNLYVLKWGAHQAREGFPAFWDANFFFPVRGALALSDHLLGPALVTAAFPNPIAAYNLLLFGSFVASGLATAWVLRAAGCGRFAAALGGAMWAFAPFRLMHLNHLQILLAQFLPLTLWLWHRLLERPTAKRAALFLLVYVLHLSGGSYLAYIAHVPLLFLLLSHLLAAPRAFAARRTLAVLLPTAAAAGLAAAALYLPYVEVSRRLGIERQDAEVRRFGATAASYLTPAQGGVHRSMMRLLLGQSRIRRPRSENALFPGLVASGLALYEAAARVRARTRWSTWERGLTGGAAACLLLSHAAVYVPLMRVVPGLAGMRVPARFHVVASLALAYWAARGADRLLARFRRPAAAAAAAVALAGFLAVELAPNRPPAWVRILREEEFPPVYAWLAERPEVAALVELPIRPRREHEAMYYSTRHWKPIANGFSGYHPPAYQELTARIRWLPDRAGLELLRRRGVTHLVVHSAPFARRGKAHLLARWREEHELSRRPAVRRVYAGGGDLVYAILGGRPEDV